MFPIATQYQLYFPDQELENDRSWQQHSLSRHLLFLIGRIWRESSLYRTKHMHSRPILFHGRYQVDQQAALLALHILFGGLVTVYP
jgi:hypothetical protein